jgi:Big-like domain-containing protein
MRVSTTRRGVALLALAGAAVATALVMAAPASAVTHVGKQPGQLSFSTQSGGPNDQPTWTSATVCPAPFNDGGQASIIAQDGSIATLVGNVNPNVKTAPFSGNVDLPMHQYVDFGIVVPNVWFEWVVQCTDPQLNSDPEQSMWVMWTDAAGDWTSTQTAPTSGTATTTSLAASNTSPANGQQITLTATVTPTNAVGAVEFFDGSTSLGAPVPVASGTATMPFSSTVPGPHSLTAKFEPTDPNAFAESTSSPVMVTVGGGAGTAGQETVNVNIQEGVFTVTVNQTSADLGTAHDNGSGKLEATGSLGTVTVSDARTVSAPGWSVSGQMGDFSDGKGHTIDGNSLGWTPSIQTPNAANDVTAGPAVAPGTNPGLKQGSGLANAAATHGLGTSVLTAGLDLQVPTTQDAGAYQGTLTITAIDAAS